MVHVCGHRLDPVYDQIQDDLLHLAAVGQDGFDDCPDRHFYDRRGYIVSHPLQSDEENYGPLLFGQFADGMLHIAKLEPFCLIRRRRQTGRTFLQFDGGALPRGPAGEADVLMVQNCE